MDERIWIEAAGEENLDRIIGRIRMLPVMPWVVNRMLEVIENENASAQDLAEVIGNDQTMTARVLKMVNSAFYGFPRKITTVSEAVVILGFNAIRSLVISLSIVELFDHSNQSSALDRRAFWLHSIATAVCCRELANKLNYPRPEEAFVVGLLHDIGKAIFNEFATADYIKAVKLVEGKDRPICDAERLVFGFDHALLGAWLSNKWELPDTLQRVIAYHHRAPEFKREEDDVADYLVRIVALADALSKVAGIGAAGDTTLYALAEAPGNLTHNMIREILNGLPDKVSHTAAGFGLADVVDLPDNIFVTDDLAVTYDGSVPSGANPFETPTALIVQSHDSFSISKLVMEQAGYRIVTAVEPNRAFQQIENENPAAVVWEGTSPLELAALIPLFLDGKLAASRKAVVIPSTVPEGSGLADVLSQLEKAQVRSIVLPSSLVSVRSALAGSRAGGLLASNQGV